METTDRSGRRVRSRRNTRRTPKILGLLLAVSEMTMSSSETNTRMPSITFQPLLRYEWRPSTKPFATTCQQARLLSTEAVERTVQINVLAYTSNIVIIYQKLSVPPRPPPPMVTQFTRPRGPKLEKTTPLSLADLLTFLLCLCLSLPSPLVQIWVCGSAVSSPVGSGRPTHFWPFWLPRTRMVITDSVTLHEYLHDMYYK